MSSPIDNRRLFLAALLSLGVLLLWQMLIPTPAPVDNRGQGGIEAESSETSRVPLAGGSTTAVRESDDEPGEAATSPEEAAARPLIVATGRESVELESDTFVATFSNRGGQLTSFRLLDYRNSGEPLELVRERSEDTPYPYSWVDRAGEELALNRELFQVSRPDRSSVTFRYSGPLGIAEKTFRILEQGFLGVSIELREASRDGEDWNLWLGPGLRNPDAKELDDRLQKRFRRASYSSAGEVGDLQASKVETPTPMPESSRWVALEDKYFLTALVPQTPLARAVVMPVTDRVVEGELEGFEPLNEVRPDEDQPSDLAILLRPAGDRLEAEAYWGAKEFVELNRLPYGLEETVRWGMFGFIAKPLLYGLRWLHDNVVHNYGWSIVLMTLLIKIVLFPLTHKSYVSMQRLQKLNPRMEGIRAKYRPKLKDKQGRPNIEMQRKMNEEMQALFKEEGVSPAGGCLPILLQMPIFFGFYQLLSQAVELWNAPWVAWIVDLTERDPYFVLPLVMGASQLAHTRMMPPAPNPSQRIIMTTMPIWFTVFALGFPSGLVLYWLTNNLLTIAQQSGYKRLKQAGFFGGPDPEPATTGKKAKAKGQSKAQSKAQ